jgi:hypothetical protein
MAKRRTLFKRSRKGKRSLRSLKNLLIECVRKAKRILDELDDSLSYIDDFVTELMIKSNETDSTDFEEKDNADVIFIGKTESTTKIHPPTIWEHLASSTTPPCDVDVLLTKYTNDDVEPLPPIASPKPLEAEDIAPGFTPDFISSYLDYKGY